MTRMVSIDPSSGTAAPTQTLLVYPGSQLCVVEGANYGDGLSFADDILLDDIYELREDACPARLALSPTDAGHFIAGAGDLATPGNDIYLDCAVTLMAPDGTTFDAVILVEVEDGEAAETYLLPLAPVAPKTGYRLVGLDVDGARKRFAEVACVSFTRGTHITLASGAQVPVENLKVGDKVLTRDDGPKEIRWIGKNTTRAVGDFAPILIRAGVLNNLNDLLVSPDHRLFIYQRSDELGAGRSEVLVKARHLVNGEAVVRQQGGFVDYYQLLFDTHQIIYAEGIAAESMLLDTRTSSAVSGDVAVDALMSGHGESSRQAYEVAEELLTGADAVDRLRKASSR